LTQTRDRRLLERESEQRRGFEDIKASLRKIEIYGAGTYRVNMYIELKLWQ
jgi:hypothetical protein